MSYGILQKIGKDSRGATMVEFAFAAPFIFLLTFGFFEFSRILYTQAILKYASQEATRYATVSFDEGNLDPDYLQQIKLEIKDVATEKMIMLDPTKISRFDVNVEVNPSDMTKVVSVVIDYDFSLVIPVLSNTHFVFHGESESFLVQ